MAPGGPFRADDEELVGRICANAVDKSLTAVTYVDWVPLPRPVDLRDNVHEVGRSVILDFEGWRFRIDWSTSGLEDGLTFGETHQDSVDGLPTVDATEWWCRGAATSGGCVLEEARVAWREPGINESSIAIALQLNFSNSMSATVVCGTPSRGVAAIIETDELFVVLDSGAADQLIMALNGSWDVSDVSNSPAAPASDCDA